MSSFSNKTFDGFVQTVKTLAMKSSYKFVRNRDGKLVGITFNNCTSSTIKESYVDYPDFVSSIIYRDLNDNLIIEANCNDKRNHFGAYKVVAIIG